MEKKPSWEFLSVPFMLILSLGLSQKANATGLGVASDYNVFTLGNFSEQYTDVEGKLAAGGNITFVGNSIGSKLAANSGNVVVAGNNLTLSNGQVNNGNIVYGGSANVSSNEGLPNGTVTKSNPIDFSAAGQELKSLSQNLASLSANGTTNVQYGGISLTGTNSQLDIFNLDASTLSSANNFTINSVTGSTVVVNVSGTSVSLQNFGFNIEGTDKQHILFNFYQATSITDSNVGVEGSILAPLANFAFNGGNVEGNVIVNSLTGVGESHNYLFQGNLPSPSPKTVPESQNLLGLGLIAGILGLSHRKTKSDNLLRVL
ncbi:MAG: choice-of-anchor A family protein [Nostoc sp.]|uniref:choice-of-anchor A family protein n=2 Tax=Nostoc sp. TaxID=1180 RepID=UPI002FF5BD7A